MNGAARPLGRPFRAPAGAWRVELRGELAGACVAATVRLTAVVELPESAAAVLRVPSPALLVGVG